MLKKFQEESYPGSGKVVDKVVISGFLGNRTGDVQTKTVPLNGEDVITLDGNPYLQVSNYNNDSKKYESLLVNIAAWRGTAERFVKAQKIGAFYVIVGLLKENPYKDKDNNEKIGLTVTVESFDIEYNYTRDLLKKNTGNQTGAKTDTKVNGEAAATTTNTNTTTESTEPAKEQTGGIVVNTADDDLPF